MPVGSTLVAFTDGLVERRTEGLEVGLQRLRRLATSQEEQTLEGLVEGLVTGLAARASRLAPRGRPAASTPACLRKVLRSVMGNSLARERGGG